MHAKISRSRHGGHEDDYAALHGFIDSTKSLCSDFRHRILHTIWGVKEIVVPVFGPVITNSDGKDIETELLCERDHLLVDFGHRFIPTLGDFVAAMDDEVQGLAANLESLHRGLQMPAEIRRLLLSPLALTGQLKSLRITHNSWFLVEILPRIWPAYTPRLDDYVLSGSDMFTHMSLRPWMDNGLTYPPSAQQMQRATSREPARTTSAGAGTNVTQ